MTHDGTRPQQYDPDEALRVARERTAPEPDDMDLCGRSMCRHARYLHSRDQRACRLASCTCERFIDHAINVDLDTARIVAPNHHPKESPQP